MRVDVHPLGKEAIALHRAAEYQPSSTLSTFINFINLINPHHPFPTHFFFQKVESAGFVWHFDAR